MLIIPRELVDGILAPLNKRSLSACTVVCRHWHLSARRLLFRQITILGTSGTHNFTNFIQFLRDSASAHLAQLVESLCLKGWEYVGPGIFILSYPEITASDIGFMISRLHRLRAFHLCRVSLRCSTVEADGLASPRSLDELSLMNIHVPLPGSQGHIQLSEREQPSSSSVVELFDKFTTIKMLRMSSIVFFENYHDPAVSRSFSEISKLGLRLSDHLRIEGLEYGDESTSFMIDLINNSHQGPKFLRVLRLSDTSMLTYDIVKCGGQWIKQLELNYTTFIDEVLSQPL